MKYLHITLHDNDFGIELEAVGHLIRELFLWFGYSKDVDLKTFSVCVQNLLYHTMKTRLLLEGKNYEIKLEYLLPTMEIVDASEIPDWDNGESLYISLYSYDIITR